jgi:hypothetical protein
MRKSAVGYESRGSQNKAGTMIKLDSDVLKRVIDKREKALASAVADIVHPDEAERRTLPPGYIAHSVADLRALHDALQMALYKERAAREDSEAA